MINQADVAKFGKIEVKNPSITEGEHGPIYQYEQHVIGQFGVPRTYITRLVTQADGSLWKYDFYQTSNNVGTPCRAKDRQPYHRYIKECIEDALK